jgi:hypothetical protein
MNVAFGRRNRLSTFNRQGSDPSALSPSLGKGQSPAEALVTPLRGERVAGGQVRALWLKPSVRHATRESVRDEPTYPFVVNLSNHASAVNELVKADEASSRVGTARG